MSLKALIFDVDGTLAETEDAHRIAFNRVFAEYDLGWLWDVETYQQLLLTTGGKERIRAYMDEINFTAPLDVDAMHARKTEIYKTLIQSGLVSLRPGVEQTIRTAREKGIALAIATTTSRANVNVLFENTLGRGALAWFSAIGCGEDVAKKKPHPDVYELVLAELDVDPAECVAIEDARAGLLAAKGAGIEHVVITPSLYTSEQDFSEATVIMKNLAKFYSCIEAGSPNLPDVLPAPLPSILRHCMD